MKDECLICLRISKIKDGSNAFFVKEMETGYVVVGDHQYYLGYTLRSEEHTSELQSQSNLVCRLLLEKKRITAPGYEWRMQILKNVAVRHRTLRRRSDALTTHRLAKVVCASAPQSSCRGSLSTTATT